MALKPTIYKLRIELADSDRGVFETLSLTVARHPSETLERMTARLLAYCLNAEPELAFSRGLSSSDEPDIWQHSASGEIEHWIDVGQPEPGRLRKACGRAQRVSVYSFGRASNTWWATQREAISSLPHLQVWQLPWSEIEQVAKLLQRTVQLNLSIVGGTLYIDNGSALSSLEPQLLMAADI